MLICFDLEIHVFLAFKLLGILLAVNKAVLILQVGVELVPRDFDMNSPHPFRKEDIISLVPVHKVMNYTRLYIVGHWF